MARAPYPPGMNSTHALILSLVCGLSGVAMNLWGQDKDTATYLILTGFGGGILAQRMAKQEEPK